MSYAIGRSARLWYLQTKEVNPVKVEVGFQRRPHSDSQGQDTGGRTQADVLPATSKEGELEKLMRMRVSDRGASAYASEQC